MKVCAVVAAAGLSSRMGAFKPLLPIDGQPAIVHLLQTFLSAGVSQVILVTGYRHAELAQICHPIQQVTCVQNPDFARSQMFDSVRLGLSAVPKSHSRMLFTPADIPLVTQPTVRQLAHASAPLMFPSYRHRRGHPIALNAALIPSVLRYTGQNGLKGALAALPVPPAYLPVCDPFIRMDMDTPSDYTALLHRNLHYERDDRRAAETQYVELSRWLQKQQIPHTFSISSNSNEICGVRLSGTACPPGYAIVSEAPSHSEYRSLLSYADNHIYFRTLSPFEVIGQLNYMLSLYSHWEQALKKLNLVRGGLDRLLSLCRELMPYPILVFQGDRMLACSPYFSEEGEWFRQQFQALSLERLVQLLDTQASECNLPANMHPVLINSPVCQGKQVILGCFCLSHQHVRVVGFAKDTPLSPGDIHLMRILTEAVRVNLSLWQPRTQSSILAFFLSCCAGEAVSLGTETVLQQLHWQPNQPYTVFWIEQPCGKDSVLLDCLYHVLRTRFPAAFCLQYESAVLLVCNLDITPEAQRILQGILPAGRFVTGQSNLSTDFSLLPQLMRQAQETMQQAREQSKPFLSAQAIMLDYMHRALGESVLLQSLVHPAIRTLAQQDAAQHTRLIDTLRTYLFLGGNCSAAAKSLGLHRNTLVSRLAHIQTLTGVALDDPQEREALLLSLLIANHPCPS